MCTNIPLAHTSTMANFKVSEAEVCTLGPLLGETVKSHGKRCWYIICFWEGAKSLEQ